MKPLLDVDETAEYLGWGRSSTYEAIKRGELPVLRRGRRIYVPRAALERLLDPDGADPPNGSEGRP